MRTIKFRAWDKENKVMRYNAEQAYNGCYQMNDVQYFGQLINNNKYELMQYTGLKDKDGKEIYEGDVLKGIEHKANRTFVNGEYQGTYEWDNDIEIIVDFTPSNMQLVDVYKSKCEVIGNIYENAELLNQD